MPAEQVCALGLRRTAGESKLGRGWAHAELMLNPGTDPANIEHHFAEAERNFTYRSQKTPPDFFSFQADMALITLPLLKKRAVGGVETITEDDIGEAYVRTAQLLDNALHNNAYEESDGKKIAIRSEAAIFALLARRKDVHNTPFVSSEREENSQCLTYTQADMYTLSDGLKISMQLKAGGISEVAHNAYRLNRVMGLSVGDYFRQKHQAFAEDHELPQPENEHIISFVASLIANEAEQPYAPGSVEGDFLSYLSEGLKEQTEAFRKVLVHPDGSPKRLRSPQEAFAPIGKRKQERAARLLKIYVEQRSRQHPQKQARVEPTTYVLRKGLEEDDDLSVTFDTITVERVELDETQRTIGGLAARLYGETSEADTAEYHLALSRGDEVKYAASCSVRADGSFVNRPKRHSQVIALLAKLSNRKSTSFEPVDQPGH